MGERLHKDCLIRDSFVWLSPEGSSPFAEQFGLQQVPGC
jgi:hypothetical protein